MTDNCKTISVTAKQPPANVSNGAKVATVETKELVTQVSSVDIAPPSQDVCYNSVLEGLGEAWVPDSRLFKYLETEFNLNEYFIKHIKKALADQFDTADIAYKRVIKTLKENTALSDSHYHVWNAFRNYSDSTTHSELFRFNSYKVINTTFTNFEQLNYVVDKHLVDHTTMADLTKILIEVRTDKHQFVDASDVFNYVVNFVRVFTDHINTTDDFFGQANIDDDQTASVVKVLSDRTIHLEAFGVNFTKAPLEHSVDNSDLVTKAYVSVKYDFANLFPSVPTFVSSLNKLEEINTTEVFSNVFTKAPIEDVATLTEQAYLSFVRPIEESFNHVDEMYLNPVKVLSHAVEFSEALVFDLLSTITDQTVTAEELSKAMSKIVDTDSLAASDTMLGKHISILFKEEDYFLSDYFLEDYFFKAVHTTDSITDVQFTKNIIDIVDATDDFYGALNLDDDQTANMHKVLSTWVSNSDVFSRIVTFYRTLTDSTDLNDLLYTTFGKIANDTAHMLDVPSKATAKTLRDINILISVVAKRLGKLLTSTTSNSDDYVFSIGKGITTTATSGEIVARSVTTVKSDSADASDLFSRVFVAFRSFSDSITRSDSHLIGVGKNTVEVLNVDEAYTLFMSKILNQTVNHTEVLRFDLSKRLNDIVDATDDFYGVTNLDDDQVASVTKVSVDAFDASDVFTRIATYFRSYTEVLDLSEVVSLGLTKPLTSAVVSSELTTKVGAKVINNTASTSQSLTIYNQDYYASNYMVPGYYGEMYSY
jgi:hypothetical protein